MKSTELKSLATIYDVIIEHVIVGYTDQQTIGKQMQKRKAFLGPAGW